MLFGTRNVLNPQMVGERLQAAAQQIPVGARPEMSPISSGLGEIFYFKLENPRLSLMERRTRMDWVVRPALKRCRGWPTSTSGGAGQTVSEWCWIPVACASLDWG